MHPPPGAAAPGPPAAAAADAEALRVTAEEVAEQQATLHESKRTHVYRTALAGVGVVAKRFKMCDEEALTRFHAERDLMMALSSGVRHVVRPIGFVIEPPTYSVVLPWFPNGSMGEVLHSPALPKPRWPLRLLFARDVCAAVAHCHASGVVVRDVKPANFLVTAQWTAHLADLELAKTEEQIRNPTQMAYGGPSSRRKTRFEGTPEYMAPELLRAPGSQLQRGVVPATPSVDVYAVGISLNELATGQVPYTGVETTTEQLNTVVETRFTPSALLNAIANDGLRPAPPTADPLCPPEWTPLAVRCWDHDPARRPAAADALAAVEAMLAAAGVPPAADRAGLLGPPPAPAPSGDAAPPGPPTEDTSRPSLRAAEQHDWPSVLRHIAASPPDGRPGRPPPLVRGGGEGTAGRRELMEDTWCGTTWHAGDGGARAFCVFDGHGGAGCAVFMQEQLPPAIERRVKEKPADIRGALSRAFGDAEAAWQQRHGAGDASGACGLAAVILCGHLWLAWCGDCRAVICRDGAALALTQDHHPGDAAERARVEAAGGSVSETRDGKLRVGGKVAVTRSFGDARRHPGIIAAPEVAHLPFRASWRDEFLVLATDGVWDVMTPERVVRNLRDTVRHEHYGAKRVVADAYNAGSTDNIGAVVVYLTDEGYDTGGVAAASDSAMAVDVPSADQPA